MERRQNWREFLERNYHFLCTNLNPNDFFTWLRSKRVLMACDQEEIMAKHTTVERMGHLVDTIQRKGESGFVAFMEVIEYASPETFSSLTGEAPRNPPIEFLGNEYFRTAERPAPKVRPMSIEILDRMGSLVKMLSTAHVDNKEALARRQEELARLQNCVSEMEENIFKEKAALYLELKCANEKVQMLEIENAKLMENLAKSHNDCEEMSSELEKLRSVKDKYMGESTQLGKAKDELRIKVQQLESEVERCKQAAESPIVGRGNPLPLIRNNSADETSASQISALHRRVSDAEKSNPVVSFEKAQLESQLRHIQSKHQMLESSYAELAVKLGEMMNERDQTIGKKRAVEEELRRQRESTRKVSIEFHEHMEKFIFMETRLMSLLNEIETLRTQQMQKQRGRSPVELRRVPQPPQDLQGRGPASLSPVRDAVINPIHFGVDVVLQPNSPVKEEPRPRINNSPFQRKDAIKYHTSTLPSKMMTS